MYNAHNMCYILWCYVVAAVQHCMHCVRVVVVGVVVVVIVCMCCVVYLCIIVGVGCCV